MERGLDDLRRQDWTLMVLHDSAAKAMQHLDGFLAQVRKVGTAFSQDFPPACVLREPASYREFSTVSPARG